MDTSASVEIEADRVEWSAGVATAEGHVTGRFADQVVVGERATWDGKVLVVENGEYRRPDGVVVFDRAEITPKAGTALVVESRVSSGGAQVSAEAMQLSEGRWIATKAEVVPCQCADGGKPALTFSAARIDVVPEKVVILRGGVVRVFGAPILPIPYGRVPLDPNRFRLLFPEVGWGEYGPSAKIEGRGGFGGWMFQGGPAWRFDRGARGELAVTGPVGKAHGELGWDALDERVRGAATTRGGVDGLARVAWDVTVVSDDDYVADYAVDYVARGVAWRDSRAVFGLGPSTTDVWLPDDGSAGTLLRERVAYQIGKGPASVTPRVGFAVDDTLLLDAGVGARASGGPSWLHLDAQGDAAWRGAPFAGDTPYEEGETSLPEWDPSALTTLNAGPSRWADALGDAPLATYRSGASWLASEVTAEASVPVWSQAGKARFQWWPGLRVGARASRILESDLAYDTNVAVRAGPGVRMTSAVKDGGVGADVALFQDGSGWTPAGSLDVHLRTVSARVQADADVQSGEVRWMPGAVSLAIGSAHADGLWLGWGDASVAVGRFRTGGGLAWNLAEGTFSGADARVGYDDGCASAMVTAGFGPDRVVPDLGLKVVLRR